MITKYIRKLPPHWERAARVFEALGSPVRQRILLLFEPGEEITIKDMVGVFDYSRTSILFHVTALEQAGLLKRRRCGKEVFFSLDKEPLLDALERVATYAREEV